MVSGGGGGAAGRVCEWCGRPLTGLQRRWCRRSHAVRAYEARHGHLAKAGQDHLESLLRSRARVAAKATGKLANRPAAAGKGGSWGGGGPGATIV